MYNDNPSVLFHSGYGLDTQMAYGQFSPMANPMSPILVDGQLYSPHQIPVSPPYFPQPVSPGVSHVTSSLPSSQSDMVTPGSNGQEGFGDNVLFGPGSGYFVHFGSFGGGGLPGEPLSNRSTSDTGSYLPPLSSPAVYSQPIGILGPYEQNAPQISQQQRPSHGFGLMASSSGRNYPQGGPYQSSNYSTASTSHWGTNNRGRLTPDKGGRRERVHDSIFVSNDSRGIASDHNRGPRASKPKGKSSAEESSSCGASKSSASISGVKLEHGMEMLRIFKDHSAETSILDDFNFYDEREKTMQERKTRQRGGSSTKNNGSAATDASVSRLADNFVEVLQLEDGKKVLRTE
ncbi:hypothetical protein U1Q18_018431 [Sarracenia purpurea var. burkii]